MSKYRNAYFILFSLKLGQNSANPNTKLLVWLDYLNQGSVESGEHPKVYHRGRQALAHQACPPLRARRRGQGRRQQARRYVRADPRPSRVQDPQAHGRVQEPASWVQERAQVSVEDGRGLPHDRRALVQVCITLARLRGRSSVLRCRIAHCHARSCISLASAESSPRATGVGVSKVTISGWRRLLMTGGADEWLWNKLRARPRLQERRHDQSGGNEWLRPVKVN